MMPRKFAVFLGLLVFLVLIIDASQAATRTLYVQETDFVKLKIDAVDPDHDQLTYTYSPPLDKHGEWQTTYGDAGEYLIEVKASDGVNTAHNLVKLIVEKKNRPPEVIKKEITVAESEGVRLKETVTDPDGDPLEYKFNEPFDEQGLWQTTYDDAGEYLMKFSVGDGEFVIDARVLVLVLPANQPPTIVSTFSDDSTIQISEGEQVKLFVTAEDDDGLRYEWRRDEHVICTEPECTEYFNFTSAGEHAISLSVTDGMTEVKRSWVFMVENTNRKPGITHLPLTVDEGEMLRLSLPEVDEDGDLLSYDFPSPLDEQGRWQTTFADAGTYKLKVGISDGELQEVAIIDVTVNDVDRAPVIDLPATIHVKEGEELAWEVKTYDEDGDTVSVVIEGLPFGAVFEENTHTLLWQPSYDVIRRKDNLLSTVLNYLRLDHYFLQQKDYPLTVKSCSKDLCTINETVLIVENVNRQPELVSPHALEIHETEKLILAPEIVDPDGDIVGFSFDGPFPGRTWQTTYGSAGDYFVNLTLDDGLSRISIPLEISVLPRNRQPEIKVKQKVIINEGQILKLPLYFSDPDAEDNVTISIDEMPSGAYLEGTILRWQPDYSVVQDTQDKTFTFFVVANDGSTVTRQPVEVTVKNVNQPPGILAAEPPHSNVTVRLQEPVLFHVVAKDPDNDPLDYTWNFGFPESKIKSTTSVERTYVTPGRKKVSVTVSDGKTAIVKAWIIDVVLEKQESKQQMEEGPGFLFYVIEQ